MGTPEAYGPQPVPQPGPDPVPQPAPVVRGGRWSHLATGADLAFMAQLVVAGAVFLATAGMRDDHGTGFAGGALSYAPRVLLLVVLAAYLHWLLFTLPAMALARLLGTTRWAAARAAVGAAAVSAAYAWGAAALWDVPFGWSAAWVGGTGLLPVTAAWYARHRFLGWGAMAARIGAVTGIALLLAAFGGFLLERTRWHAYEAPRLDRSRYVGEWTGAGGAYRLRLGEDGAAEAANLPLAEGHIGVWDSCSGTGTWRFEPQRDSGGLVHGGPRDRVTLTIEGCRFGDWEVAGTAGRPELFYVDRDPGGPGGPDVTILHRL
ncbi:hypothetical protein [Streptomyces sp. NPDC056387]|uniref:hypothetical protein n=1 Tax=Streptomyces sp. NPDC056387 TaxID=3345803 RepID=UPI0035E35D0F